MSDAQSNGAVVLLSGGMDSATLLYVLLSKGEQVEAISFNYGQRHSKELECAGKLCAMNQVRHTIVDLRCLDAVFLGCGSSLVDTDVDVPIGHYADESMKATVVPNRNMIMLSIATALAISRKFRYVAYAAHAGDHDIYPDCRSEFTDELTKAIQICDWSPIVLMTPFIQKTKAEIVKIGYNLKVPYHETWSCYEGEDIHCGNCGTDVERREAFILAGMKDPTTYAPNAQPLNELLKKD